MAELKRLFSVPKVKLNTTLTADSYMMLLKRLKKGQNNIQRSYNEVVDLLDPHLIDITTQSADGLKLKQLAMEAQQTGDLTALNKYLGSYGGAPAYLQNGKLVFPHYFMRRGLGGSLKL